ncbi:HNH endonuclease [Turicibacter sanguinis]|uniref:HNH endonuclease n=1 Tax=Turicibacter sanguinis TaxID=154288 RepID=UPI0012BB66CE|nr:HNH endonuclease signature motif containing protein [Turicibacter sanguinis]MCU7196711.1 HNH endonuclease [Turicibacter sanguinis]MDB8439115.1 HNH endonuclease signature motif containing protein [Turicibacter sanguinis]MTO25230.1 hypothetical protein [Turicibacter sanguinis]MTO27888.1 hypothetical protein [Turicibacter sanguinis]MTO90803.1 hypothetical protein [Turicibacter sanguinis]
MHQQKLIQLAAKNNISEDRMYKSLYDVLVLSLFEHLTYLMKDQQVKNEILSTFHKTFTPIANTERLVKKYTGCNVTETETQIICELLLAYFRKNGIRKQYSNSFKCSLLKQQNYKCPFCNKNIDLNTSELDHIVPWHYVGDELDSNLQLLCDNCNERKGKRIDFQIKMLLINKYYSQ